MINGRDPFLDRFITSALTQNSNGGAGYHDDPTTMGFTLLFQFTGEESPLFNESDHGESAIAYLESVDEPEHAESLRRFKTRLQDLQLKFPYYFQELDGLKGINVLDWKIPFEHERILTITTLESIDQRMGALISDYVDSVFDFDMHRMRLPQNLQEFKLVILVSEIRQFRSMAKALQPSGAGGDYDLNLQDINENIGTYVFKFKNCTFDFGMSQSFLDTVSVTQPKVADNRFSIKCGHGTHDHKVGFLDLFVKQAPDNHISSLKPPAQKGKVKVDFEKRVKDFYKNQGGTAKSVFKREAGEFLGNNDPAYIASRTLETELFGVIDSQIKRVVFGNVFDSSREFLGRSLGVGDIAKAINSLFGHKDDDRKLANQDVLNGLKGISGEKSTLGETRTTIQSTMPSSISVVQLPPGADFDSEDLSRVGVGLPSSPGRPNLSEIDMDGPARHTMNPVVVDTNAASTDASALGSVPTAARTGFSTGLDNVEIADPSTDSNGLGSVSVAALTRFVADLNEIDAGSLSDMDRESLNRLILAAQADISRVSLGKVDTGMLSVMASNIPGFTQAPISATLEAIFRSNLGSVSGNKNPI